MTRTNIRARERAHTADCFIQLENDEGEQVRRVAYSLVDRVDSVDSHQTLVEAAIGSHQFPPRVTKILTLARLDERTGTITVRGNLIDDQELGDTPRRWAEANNSRSLPYALTALMYGSLLGDPIAWATQQDGRVVTDVVATPGMESSLISASSTRELSWHTEDAFSPHRAEWVGLYCLRNSQEVPTTVSTILSDSIPDDIRNVLSQARFVMLPDSAHSHSSSSSAVSAAPVLQRSGGVTELRIDRDFTRPLPGDTAAAEALAWMIAQLDGALVDLVLIPGDMVFINNRLLVHGRRPFQPSFAGRGRWLKRVNVVRDLRPSRSLRSSSTDRVIQEHSS